MRFCCGVPSGTSRTNWLTDAVARNAEQEVRLLAEELYSTSASRQLQGLHRLVELTAHSDIYRGVCPAAHVLPPLGKMIENAEQEPESGVLAAKALANITKCSSTHRHLITAGAVPVLLGLLDHASCHTSTRCAMQALRNLTASQPVAVLQTADAAQLMSKVERRVMASAEASVQQAGAQLLLNLSAASMQRPTQSLLLGSVGWVASLVRILQDRIGLDLEARDMLVETLLNLTQECRTNRQLMVEEGGLDLVFCIARSSDCSPAVWVAVVSLFRALASDGWAAELVDGGAVELVLQLLRASEPDDDRFCPALVKEEAALALQHLSHADDSARLRSIQVGAVQELLSTITTTSTVGHCVVIAACQALYAICMTRAGQQAVLSQQALPVIVATLRDELQRRSADSQDCESLVLLVRRLVCHGAPQAVPQLVQEAGLPVFVDLLHSASGRSATKRHAFSILVGVSSFRDHRFKEHFGVRAVYMAGALPVLSKLLYQASRPRPSSGSKGQPSGGLAVADCWQWVSWTAHMLHQMLEDPTLQGAVLQQLTRHRLSHVRRLARQSCRGLQELLQNMARDSQPEFLLFEPKPLPGPRPPPGVLPQRCNGASHSRLG